MLMAVGSEAGGAVLRGPATISGCSAVLFSWAFLEFLCLEVVGIPVGQRDWPETIKKKSDFGEGEEGLKYFDLAKTLLTLERFPTLKHSALHGGDQNMQPWRWGLCCSAEPCRADVNPYVGVGLSARVPKCVVKLSSS